MVHVPCSPPWASKLEQRGAPVRPFPLLAAVRSVSYTFGNNVGRVDVRIRLSSNINISLIIASIADVIDLV